MAFYLSPQVILTQPVARQQITATLSGQSVVLNIYQMNQYGLFMDVGMNGIQLVTGVLCQNANTILRDAYFGFPGDLAWYDMINLSDPQPPYYTGLGSRWLLMYLPGQAS